MEETNPQKFAALLADDSKWRVVPGVPVFDEHVETYSVKGPDGKPQSITENFDVPRLQKIADKCNQLVASGNPIGLTAGHTSDSGRETDQPETLGYAVNYRVANHPTLGRPCIFHDEKFYPDKYELARTMPFRSVERWRPNAENPIDYFKPVALLRREPRRLLGAVAYQKPNGCVIRYSMESYAMADEKETTTVEDKGPPSKPEAPPAVPPVAQTPPPPPAMPPAQNAAPPAPAAPPAMPAPAPAPMEPSDQDKQLFAAMCKYFKVQYADPSAAMAAPGGMAPPMPGGMPPAPPVQNGMASPSGSNVMPPVMNKEPMKMSADNADVVRYQQQIESMQERIAELEKGERLARYAAKVQQLAADGYPINVSEELVRCQDYSQDQFDYHVEQDIKKYGAANRLPVGPGVRPDGSPNPMAARTTPSIDSKETMDKVLRYQAESGKPFHEAKAHVLAGSPVR